MTWILLLTVALLSTICLSSAQRRSASRWDNGRWHERNAACSATFRVETIIRIQRKFYQKSARSLDSCQQMCCMMGTLECKAITFYHEEKACFTHDSLNMQTADRPVEQFTVYIRNEPGFGQNMHLRVYGGRETEVNEFPWMAELRNYKNKNWCGASIVHKKWLVTAAHCVDEASPDHMTLRVAGHTADDGRRIKMEKIVRLKQYNNDTNEHDIAMIKLASPLRWIQNRQDQFLIKGIRLSRRYVGVGTSCIAAGWGQTETGPASDRLLKISVPILDRGKCIRAYGANKIFPYMLCAGHWDTGKIDTCKGDSGGPLMCRNPETDDFELSGIVSWGGGCAMKKNPGVYTRVAPYVSWINRIIDKHSA